MASFVRPILIAGGGIGGLATALAIARHGIDVEVLERDPTTSEEGAGIQLGPNAVSVLQTLGVADALEATSCAPAAIAIRSGADGRHICDLPLGAAIARRHGAPYWTAHRADLQHALAAAVRSHPRIHLREGFAVDRINATNDVVNVTSAIGEQRNGQALIGADGRWSRVRTIISGETEMPTVGHVAYRTIFDAKAVLNVDAANVSVWLAPNLHVVTYPIRNAAQIAVVVVSKSVDAIHSWSGETSSQAVVQLVAGLTQTLRATIGQPATWRSWTLGSTAPLSGWSHGRVTLLGDAAHPVLPFFAQGAALALEDAIVLSNALAASRDDPARAFQRYEALRRGRVARVQSASIRNGEIYHLSGLGANLRDAALRRIPGHIAMRRFDWLYGWKS